uniref:Uncharacterized protein n=1 Tax=Tetranychus urticae TaxID=32264 RepID=T1L120_TETUR
MVHVCGNWFFSASSFRSSAPGFGSVGADFGPANGRFELPGPHMIESFRSPV